MWAAHNVMSNGKHWDKETNGGEYLIRYAYNCCLQDIRIKLRCSIKPTSAAITTSTGSTFAPIIGDARVTLGMSFSVLNCIWVVKWVNCSTVPFAALSLRQTGRGNGTQPVSPPMQGTCTAIGWHSHICIGSKSQGWSWQRDQIRRRRWRSCIYIMHAFTTQPGHARHIIPSYK